MMVNTGRPARRAAASITDALPLPAFAGALYGSLGGLLVAQC